MAKRAGSKKADQPTEAQAHLLARLKDIAAAIEIDVREERLTREVGYSVRSGVCKIEGRDVLLLDRNVAPADRIELLASILAKRDLESVYIEPELREFLGQPESETADPPESES